MNKFIISFIYVPYNVESTFVPDLNMIQTTATIMHTKEKNISIFHVKLNDIGLDSLFGEFNIIIDTNFWQVSDVDSNELNKLKENIINELYKLGY